MALAFLLLLGGVAGWFLRDRAAQEAVVEQGATQALAEVEGTSLRENLPKALAALKRAEVLLEGGGSAGLRRRVSRWRADLDLVARLQDAMLPTLQPNVEEWRFSMELAIPAYEAAFRAHGLDPASVPAEEAVRRVTGRPPQIRMALI